jgi:hypothetical protein
MFVMIFHAIGDTPEQQFTSTASACEKLIREEYIDSYTVKNNGSQRQLCMTTVAGNKISIIEPSCQSLCLDLLKGGHHQ